MLVHNGIYTHTLSQVQTHIHTYTQVLTHTLKLTHTYIHKIA